MINRAIQWNLSWETNCLDKPHIFGRRTYISIQLNLSPETTCLDRPHFCVQWDGLSRQVLLYTQWSIASICIDKLRYQQWLKTQYLMSSVHVHDQQALVESFSPDIYPAAMIVWILPHRRSRHLPCQCYSWLSPTLPRMQCPGRVPAVAVWCHPCSRSPQTGSCYPPGPPRPRSGYRTHTKHTHSG